MKFLVVDDSLIMRKSLVFILESLNYEVVAVSENGQEAVEMYKKYRPDVITMDITMPIMTGLEALIEIKKINKDTNVIMATSVGEEKSIMKAISNGAVGYIRKPIIIEELEKIIKRLK